jgi:hypothetical protein
MAARDGHRRGRRRPIARIEMSVAGSGEWFPFFPARRHLRPAARGLRRGRVLVCAAGPVVIAVRVYDQANNFLVRHVTLP